jgi:hypothetical protein
MAAPARFDLAVQEIHAGIESLDRHDWSHPPAGNTMDISSTYI